ncbi:MAG TPA: AraC family transcriptional regulator [Pseudonocardiaceae bacterium]|jgi:AraC-like DNA-binding protein|nr:AraC family transcriptional regulator [Pseudonocardiaceae bacterium]
MPTGQLRRIRTATIDATSTMSDQLDMVQRYAQLGSVGIGDYTFLADTIVDCDDVGATYYVHLPITGRLASRYGGFELIATREAAAVYRPEGGSFHGRWQAGCRALCIGIDRAAVDAALAKLLGDQPASLGDFALTMNTGRGFARTWVDLMASLGRQVGTPNGLLSQPMVAGPLAESVVNGFLMATRHSYSDVLAAPVTPARPLAVRTAVDLMEADPGVPWTVSTLAARCEVGVRTLQAGFRDHLGLSPMTYLRDVRLRRAHQELRAADPFVDSVASIARRWGFGHLGRFAAAHEAKYGQTPLRTLRAVR